MGGWQRPTITVEWSYSPNLKGFISSVADDGGRGEIFYRNDQELGVCNHSYGGPDFGNIYSSDLYISDFFQAEQSHSMLGGSYGRGPDIDKNALFGQERFRVVDYEVFKIVIK
jgi:hypothetical protein